MIVMPVTRPNCWNGTNGLNNSTANASAVVRADPMSADPVVASACVICGGAG